MNHHSIHTFAGLGVHLPLGLGAQFPDLEPMSAHGNGVLRPALLCLSIDCSIYEMVKISTIRRAN